MRGNAISKFFQRKSTTCSFDGILLQEKDKIYSKKREKGEEGIGILSIKKLCGKNGGTCKFEADGNRFQASFLLKNM